MQYITFFKSLLTRKRIEIGLFISVICCAINVMFVPLTKQMALKLDDQKMIYQGSVVKNKIDGKGKITFENGDVYEGDFKNGIFHGQGVFTATKGWHYIGDFSNGKMHGIGKLTTKDNKIFEGKFEEGVYQNEN